MYYLYNNGQFIYNCRTIKGLMEFISDRNLGDAYNAAIMEGINGDKYHICPVVLQYIADVMTAGATVDVQALGESVTLTDFVDVADLLRKYKTERLYLGDFDVIHSSGECYDTVYR